MNKQPPKPKKKVDPKLSQKDKFIEHAHEVEVDETGETFNKAIKKIVPYTEDKSNL